MQYKIPVQIENDDPIVLWLSLKQLAIIMVWAWIAYAMFNSLVKIVWQEISSIFWIIIFAITLLIALFKQYEMTFVPFILALLRFNISFKERTWQSTIDSFSPLDIWIISITEVKNTWNIDVENKSEKIIELQEKLNRL